MKYLLRSVVLLVSLVIVGLASCSRAPEVKSPKGAENVDNPANVFQTVLNGFRYPENPSDSDDWTRFREGIRPLDSYFAGAEVLDRIGKAAAAQRKFLQTELGLSAAELAEVEATSFRTADAHYLDECFLLHETARSLAVRNLPAAEQAHLCFQWVMRNVLPHEQGDSNTPPAFTLRRGYGSPMERAIVFLALLRQAQIEGCLILAPGSAPLPFLVGVHDAKTSSLRLFDTRLGLAVISKDGKSIATLQEAIDDPALLRPSAITPEQAKKLEPWVVCPLHALAPRLFELQRGLSPFEPLTLYMNAGDVHKEISKAAKAPVKVWKADVEFLSPRSEKHKAIIAPTRWLRTFVPKEEGGIDESKRTELFAIARIPFPSIMVNYAQINMTERLLPGPVFRSLQNATQALFSRYALQTREMHLRGRHDAMIRRQERMQFFVRHEALLGLLRNETFAKERLEWQQKVKQEHADLVIDAKAQAQMQRVAAIWIQDVFIRYLLDVESEKQLDRTDKTSVKTQILAVGIRDYFEAELPRSRAAADHEKAARAQALLRASAKPSAAVKERAREAWEIASSGWGNSYLDRITMTGLIESQRKQAAERRPLSDIREEVHTQISLLEKLHLDLHKFFQAKFRLAECREALAGAKSARAYLESTKAEIESLEKMAILKKDVQDLSDALRGSAGIQAFFQPRLDLLARDWSQDGSYFWLKQHIDRRLAGLSNN